MNNNKILWIDDDIGSSLLMAVRDALSDKGFVITGVDYVDDLFNILESQKDFACIIIDLSMAQGEKLSFEEAKYGTRTGLAILKKLQDKYKDTKFIVFTQLVNAEDVQQYCKEKKEKENNFIPFCMKSDYPSPDKFADMVYNFINNNDNSV